MSDYKEKFEKMRVAGNLAARTLDMLTENIKEGISTDYIDKLGYEFIRDHGGYSAPLYYRGFEKSLCTSLNHVVCHGIPDDNRVLKNGDIMNIDVTVIKDGYHGDTSKMYFVGKKQPHAERLVSITQECLYKAIAICKPGINLGDIGYEIQKHAEDNHYSVVRDYCGHGIGKVFHEDPQILHYGNPGTGMELKAGMCFTIEPMINLGTYKTKLSKNDGWTVETVDGRLSAQWEHTILITDNGCEVLTARSEEVI